MKIDGITLIIIIIMTLCLAVACFWIYEHKYDSCSSNPLTYASQYYGEQVGYPLVGYVWVQVPMNYNPERFYFNSTGIYKAEYIIDNFA